MDTIKSLGCLFRNLFLVFNYYTSKFHCNVIKGVKPLDFSLSNLYNENEFKRFFAHFLKKQGVYGEVSNIFPMLLSLDYHIFYREPLGFFISRKAMLPLKRLRYESDSKLQWRLIMLEVKWCICLYGAMQNHLVNSGLFKVLYASDFNDHLSFLHHALLCHPQAVHHDVHYYLDEIQKMREKIWLFY